MDSVEVAIGLDVGKSFHYVWAEDVRSGKVLYKGQVKNAEAHLEKAFTRCARDREAALIVDQPNSIGALAVRVGAHLGFQCFYLASSDMRREAERQGKSSKTDKADAEVICRSFSESPKLLHPVIADAARSKIAALRSRDRDLSADETRALNRLRAALVEVMPEFEAACADERLRSRIVLEALSQFGGPWAMKAHLRAFKGFCDRFSGKVPKGLIHALADVLSHVEMAPVGVADIEGDFIGAVAKDILRIQGERACIEAKIDEILKDDEDYKNLLTMPGVGKKTAATLVAEVGDVARFKDPFAFSRYAGIAPKVDKSGTSIDRKLSDRHGNARLRHALFTSAFASLKVDSLSYEFYCKKRAAGKSFAAAILALARKRAKVIYAMLRDKTAYGAHQKEAAES